MDAWRDSAASISIRTLRFLRLWRYSCSEHICVCSLPGSQGHTIGRHARGRKLSDSWDINITVTASERPCKNETLICLIQISDSGLICLMRLPNSEDGEQGQVIALVFGCLAKVRALGSWCRFFAPFPHLQAHAYHYYITSTLSVIWNAYDPLGGMAGGSNLNISDLQTTPSLGSSCYSFSVPPQVVRVHVYKGISTTYSNIRLQWQREGPLRASWGSRARLGRVRFIQRY